MQSADAPRALSGAAEDDVVVENPQRPEVYAFGVVEAEAVVSIQPPMIGVAALVRGVEGQVHGAKLAVPVVSRPWTFPTATHGAIPSNAVRQPACRSPR